MSFPQSTASATGDSAATAPAIVSGVVPVAAAAVRGEVLIASHGGASGAAAIRIGRAIAARWGAPAEILGVVTPVLLYPPEVPVNVAPVEEAGEESLQAQLDCSVLVVPARAVAASHA